MRLIRAVNPIALTPPVRALRVPGARRRRQYTLRGLGADDKTVALAMEFTEEAQKKIAELGLEYDRQQPNVSFARWLSDTGNGVLLSQFKAYLELVGQTDVLAALDAEPNLTGEAYAKKMLEKWDAPLEGGPWALNEAGDWFTVTNPAPGSTITRGNIYVPVQLPSIKARYVEPASAEVRFTDAKHRAVNRATLKSDWDSLFMDIAPRGGGPDGIGAGRAWDGTPDDYDWEGGRIYPGLTYELKGKSGKAVAQELVDWWANRYWGKPEWGGTNNLDLDWVRVYTDENGYRKYKPWVTADIASFGPKWTLAKNGYVCPEGEINDGIVSIIAEQANRQRDLANLPDAPWANTWIWPLDPIHQCMPTSSSRRRKVIRKAAAVAAVVVGAVFLGPMIAGAVKNVAAKLAGSGIGKAVTAAIPKVVDAANLAKTVKAVQNGEVPPPPISLEGDSFKDYAASVASGLLEQQLADAKQELTAKQQELQAQQLQQEIERIRQQTAATLPGGVPMYPVPSLTAPVVSSMTGAAAAQAQQQSALEKYGLLAAVLLAGVLIARA